MYQLKMGKIVNGSVTKEDEQIVSTWENTQFVTSH